MSLKIFLGVIRPVSSLLASDPESATRFADFVESKKKDGQYEDEAGDYCSPALVLLVGSGADEQFGGIAT